MSAPAPVLTDALRPFVRRARARWLLEWLRWGLLWGQAVASVPLLIARVLPWDGALPWAGAGLLLALGVAATQALRRLPGVTEAALAADGLGLQERVITALYASQVKDPVMHLAEADARIHLSRVDPAGYLLVPAWRRWQGVGLLALVVVGLSVVPGSGPLEAARRRADREAVSQAASQVRALDGRWPAPIGQVSPVARAALADLRALEEKLRREDDRQEAARAIEETRAALTRQADPADAAWEQALSGLQAAWRDSQALAGVRAALEARDPRAVQDALEALRRQAAEAGATTRRQLGLELQSGANAATAAPELASALRQAAWEFQEGAGDAGRAGPGEPGEPSPGAGRGEGASPGLERLAQVMTAGTARASAFSLLSQQIKALGNLSASLAAGAPGPGATVASGAASGGAGAAGGAAGAAGAVRNGAAGGGGPGNGAGEAAGPGAFGGTGPGAGGSGSGGAAGSSGQPGSGPGGGGSGSGGAAGAGSGIGSGSGSGSGSGAGAGGGPGGSRPGPPQGTGSGGGLPTADPGSTGAIDFPGGAAPSLLGGSGRQVQGPRQAGRGEGEEMVTVPDSPLTVGSVRPLSEVYGEYQAEARRTLAQAPLPPALQGMVYRYFSGVAPEPQK